MIRTLKLVSLVSMSAACGILATTACGNSDKDTGESALPGTSTTTSSTGTTDPTGTGTGTGMPTGTGTGAGAPTNTAMPPTGTMPTGTTAPTGNPTGSGTGMPTTDPTGTETAPTTDPTDTTMPTTDPTDVPTDMPTGSGTDEPPAPTMSGTTTPNGPPEGAYVACSGTPVPELKLTPVIQDLDSPTYITFPASDPDTMYVVLRGGELLRYDMTMDPPASVTLLELGTSTANECGFLSIALHPKFDGTTEKRMYVSYMPTCPAGIFDAGGSSTLDEYTLDGDTATKVKTILSLDQPQGNHNGGLAKFGPDGYLYFGLGDGGGGNDNSTGHATNGNGQTVTTVLGKMLRFDVDDIETPPPGNLTPEDVGGAEVDTRILHYGLRNPWRWSFDQLNGDLYIGDVGQDTWEEIDYLPAGTGVTNFGWSAREGLVACGACSSHTVFPQGSTAHDPIHVYPTNAGGSGIFKGSVIGGYVYRGNKIPGLYGRYIFGEFVRSNIFALTVGEDGKACDEIEDLIPSADIPNQSISSFGQDPNGEVYVLNMTRGEVLRIDAAE